MMKHILRLLRVHQWYKNLLIFLPLIFAKQLLNPAPLIYTLIGFVALCLISSTNYVINDIVDRNKDKLNKEKCHRPIASGKVKISLAIILAITLFIISMFIASKLSLMFVILVLTLFVLTQLYSFKLKNEIFVDIILISINFVIRTASGVYVIENNHQPYIPISVWLIFCTFFLALFLAVIKRKSELMYLKERSIKHRKVLADYSFSLISSLMIISTSLLVTSYALYTFFGQYKLLYLTLPFGLYIILRLYYLTEKGSMIARHLNLAYKDKRLIISSLITIFLVLIIIYI